MKTLKWWICGLAGAIALSVSTLVNAFYSIPRILSEGGDWDEFCFTGVSVFIMGFLCGVLVWSSLGFAKRFGVVGDILIGVFAMIFFFALCMLVFARDLLVPDPARGLPMFLFAIPVGALLGHLTGKDLRQFLAKSQKIDRTSRCTRPLTVSRLRLDCSYDPLQVFGG